MRILLGLIGLLLVIGIISGRVHRHDGPAQLLIRADYENCTRIQTGPLVPDKQIRGIKKQSTIT